MYVLWGETEQASELAAVIASQFAIMKYYNDLNEKYSTNLEISCQSCVIIDSNCTTTTSLTTSFQSFKFDITTHSHTHAQLFKRQRNVKCSKLVINGQLMRSVFAGVMEESWFNLSSPWL